MTSRTFSECDVYLLEFCTRSIVSAGCLVICIFRCLETELSRVLFELRLIQAKLRLFVNKGKQVIAQPELSSQQSTT